MKPDSSSPPIAVIGCGLGGALLASELGLRGFSVRIADRDSALIEPLAAAGGIEVTGRESGFAPVEMATTDAGGVVTDTSVVLVSTSATEHRSVATTIAPHLSNGQVVLLVQGHFGGALEMRAAMAEAGCTAQVTIAEMDMFPFFGGKLTTTHVELDQPRLRVGVATLPPKKAEEVIAQLKYAFPMAEPKPHVLHTGFADLSPLVHSVPMVLNVNTVEREGGYTFYRDMMDVGVVRVIERCDAERLEVAATFGVSLPSIFEYYSGTHKIPEDSLLGVFRIMGDTTFRFAPAPKSFDHRYITQDLGVSMVGWSTVAAIAGVQIPMIDSIIELAGALASTDFRREGRNAKRLGLQSAEGADDIMAAVLADSPLFA